MPTAEKASPAKETWSECSSGGEKNGCQKSSFKDVNTSSEDDKNCPKEDDAKGGAANESAPKKQAAVRKPRRVEKLLAGAEVPREFTMTIQVSGHEFLADPVAATRRVLILALAQIPTNIHQEQIDKLVRAKYLFSRVLQGQFPETT